MQGQDVVLDRHLVEENGEDTKMKVSSVMNRRGVVTDPFFISPAYSVPRMTISFSAKLIATDVDEVIPSVNLFAGNAPAL